jgi:hypothetical protein
LGITKGISKKIKEKKKEREGKGKPGKKKRLEFNFGYTKRAWLDFSSN